jgi:hypothetical protein
MYKNVGTNFADKIIIPAVSESVKANTAKFSATDKTVEVATARAFKNFLQERTCIVDTDISNNKKIRMQVTTKVDRFNLSLREGCIVILAMEHNTSFSAGYFHHNNAPLQLEVQNLMNYYVDN